MYARIELHIQCNSEDMQEGNLQVDLTILIIDVHCKYINEATLNVIKASKAVLSSGV